jgi:DNA-directed RNA polymerase subunit RPC12/RpoP
MTSHGEYKCLDCGDVFENRIQAALHHLNTKHQNYELVATGIKMNIKS